MMKFIVSYRINEVSLAAAPAHHHASIDSSSCRPSIAIPSSFSCCCVSSSSMLPSMLSRVAVVEGCCSWPWFPHSHASRPSCVWWCDIHASSSSASPQTHQAPSKQAVDIDELSIALHPCVRALGFKLGSAHSCTCQCGRGVRDSVTRLTVVRQLDDDAKDNNFARILDSSSPIPAVRVEGRLWHAGRGITYIYHSLW